MNISIILSIVLAASQVMNAKDTKEFVLAAVGYIIVLLVAAGY